MLHLESFKYSVTHKIDITWNDVMINIAHNKFNITWNDCKDVSKEGHYLSLMITKISKQFMM